LIDFGNSFHCLLRLATFIFPHGCLLTKLIERLLSKNGKISSLQRHLVMSY